MTPFSPDWMLWLSLAPFAAAFVAPWLVRTIGAAAGWVLAIVPALLFVFYAGLLPRIGNGEAIAYGVDWAPMLGVRYAHLIDGLSLTFALLVTGIGTLIVIYAGGYLKGYAHQGRFMMFLLLFMGAMLGLVVADDLITLFIFYELTSITSFLLIGFDHKREAARRAAVQALVVTGGGGLALLAGIILIRIVTGEGSVTGLLAMPEDLRDAPAYAAIAVLIMLGAFTKSAQVPFHSWLPNAMEAPTPVSAYLHSATMVKAGVFVLMRFSPTLGGTPLWEIALTFFGGLTFLTGVVLGLRQTDLKQVLAYTTVASLGLLVMLTGVGTEYAITGAVLYLVAHAFFKGGLFMIAGAIDHETGTRDLRVLGGLMGKMPITFVATVLACLSMAGLPPFIGFVAKEVLYDGVWQATGVSVVTLVSLVGNAVMFAIAGVLLFPFLKSPGEMPKSPHEAPLSLILGPVVLAVIGVLSALLLSDTLQFIALPMASAVAGAPVDLQIYLIPPGLKPPVILTIITVASGIGLLFICPRLRDGVARGLEAIGWGPDKGFDQLISGLVRASFRLTKVIQPGSMKTYVAVVFAVLAVALLLPQAINGGPELIFVGEFPEGFYFGIFFVAVIGLLVVLLARSRVVAIVSLGIQGSMVALIFMLYGAPDLSFTQFMVETLSVVILALVMTRLDLRANDRRPPWRVGVDATIALSCGLGFCLLLMSVVQQTFDPRLSEFFLRYAYDIANGQNVVNVILVDFRALDTLGEIAVVMGAGIAILALIRLRPQTR
ncbi:MAG: putative monovalent cation/H+ antiporter subunit A [Pseudomonadota bacterium]